MSTCVVLFAVADPTDEELARAESLFNSLSHLGDPTLSKTGTTLYKYQAYKGVPTRVEVYSLSRYFGPFDTRGNWPLIADGISALAECFPGCDLFYGNDEMEDEHFYKVTTDLLKENWDVWYENN